jgi:hypothetical protein
MRNLINRLFQSRTTTMTSNPLNSEPSADAAQPTTINPGIFAEPVENPTAASTSDVDPVKELLSRQHQSIGYSEGYDFHDVIFSKNYKSKLVEEFRDILKMELRRLDAERVRLDSMLSQRDELSIFIIQELEKQLATLNLKHTHLLDEFEAAEFERGRIKMAILDYERGFEQGFRDFLATSQYVSAIQNA